MTELVPLIFPWEVLLLVFERSDPSTLAALGAVSMEVLEATTPLLYGRVEVNSITQLESLFCERQKESTTSPPSRVNNILSLTQINTFRLDLLSSQPSYEAPSLSLSRITPAASIPLNLLQLSTNHNNRNLLVLLHYQLFPHFNPVRVEYDTRDRPSDSTPIYALSSLPLLLGFDRLTTLDFKGLIPVICNFSVSPSSYHAAGLPTPSLARRRTVRLHLASLLPKESPYAPSFLKNVATTAAFSVELMQEGSMVLVVRTEEEKLEAEVAVEQLHEGKRIKFAVELEI